VWRSNDRAKPQAAAEVHAMEEWYYTTNNQQQGPVSWEKLEQLASSGRLKPSDMVWKEGMTDWARAERKGLFMSQPKPARTAEPADEEVEERPRRRPVRDEDEDDDRPRRRPRADDDDEDDRPRRRRRVAATGMPLGAKVAIVGGSVMAGLLVLILVIVLLVRGGSGTYTVRLLPNQKHTTTLRLSAGQNSIRVTSSVMNPMCDIDLFVETENGQRVAADTAISKDCFVTFMAPAADSYRVSVVNLGPGSATCVVTRQ
jgi:hypothetical protein